MYVCYLTNNACNAHLSLRNHAADPCVLAERPRISRDEITKLSSQRKTESSETRKRNPTMREMLASTRRSRNCFGGELVTLGLRKRAR